MRLFCSGIFALFLQVAWNRIEQDIAGIDMLKLPHCNSSGLRSGTALLLGKITVLMPTTQMWLLASYNDECSLRHLHGLPEGCGRETQNRQV